MSSNLRVELGERSYPVHIGRGLLDRQELLIPSLTGRQVMVISNVTVAPLFLERLCATLIGYEVSTMLLPDGEQHKNLSVLSSIYDRLLQERHERSTTLIALGGGVVGDITGFAAATYLRGVNFIQVPTTLLAQVDSSVGGKTAVNHPLGKNMVGAFYQPGCVIADLDTLATLPPREYAAGLAEVVKYGLIADREFYGWIEDNAGALAQRDMSALQHAVSCSCAIKAAIVADDERESGRRALLNFGHTFGHAIETATGYTSWLHGEAVAVGMVMAMRLSVLRGSVATEELARLTHLLQCLGLPVEPPADITPAQFFELMMLDKKVLDGRIRLVLLDAPGAASLCTDYDPRLLDDCLGSVASVSSNR